MKHTQGEWGYDFQNKHIIDSVGNIVPMPDKFSCSPRTEEETFGHLKEWQEAQANIKLVIASPDLLAALIEIKEHSTLFELRADLYDKAVLAIQKAIT